MEKTKIALAGKKRERLKPLLAIAIPLSAQAASYAALKSCLHRYQGTLAP